MLDKTKLYYVNDRRTDIVKILFEDDISWYVEEVNQRVDSHNNPIRRSCKKSAFRLNECGKKYIFFAQTLIDKGYEVEGASYVEAYNKFKEFLNNTTIGAAVYRRADFDRSTFIKILGDYNGSR